MSAAVVREFERMASEEEERSGGLTIPDSLAR